MDSPLRAFVSSKMQELSPERSIVKKALDSLEISAWIFEEDAGARSMSIQETYLKEIEETNLYIGIFWKNYGEYTVEEFEHALKCRKDCLIYEKRDGIEGQRTQQLQDFLDRIGNVKTGLTVRWFQTSEQLSELVKKDVARWQATIIRSYKESGGTPKTVYAAPPIEEINRQQLLILHEKVRQFWIEGVLERSVHHEALLALGKNKIADAVEHPWESDLEIPGRDNQSISSTIIDVYNNNEVERRLLILGEPGSGKTTTLLELTRDLLIQAENNISRHVPVIFLLSGWTNKYGTLNEWLINELKTKYKIHDEIGEKLLASDQLLIFLDGLDEVNPDIREECVDTINRFITDSLPPGIVVCSRLTEYMALGVRLKLNAAVCLQPLTPKQVDEYLNKAGVELNALRAAVKSDTGLQALTQSPLMLNIMSLAYRNSPVEELEQNSDTTVKERRSQVFDLYIERMFERKGKSSKLYAKEKVKYWLSWLAEQMQSRSQTAFLIEQLQPNWLVTWFQRIAYLLISRLLAGLCLGLGLSVPWGIVIFALEKPPADVTLIYMLSSCAYLTGYCLGLGLITFIVDTLMSVTISKANNPASKIIKWQSAISFLLYAIVWSLLMISSLSFLPLGHITSLEDMYSFDGIATVALILTYSIAHWFIFKSSDLEEPSNDIRTIEILSWSWSGALKTSLWSSIILLIFFFPVTISSRYMSYTFEKSMLFSKLQETELEKKRQIANIERDISAIGLEISASKQNEVGLDKVKLEQDLNSLRERESILKIEIENLDFQINQLEHKRYISYSELVNTQFKEIFIQSVLSAIFTGIFIGILFGGSASKIIERKSSPNEGIKLTARNAILAGGRRGIIFGFSAGLFAFWMNTSNRFLDIVYVILVASTIVGILFSFRLGIYNVIKHYCLRVILFYKGNTPWNYVNFLNHCTKIIFLQRVGGGYIFIHRLLLEHFASFSKAKDDIKT